MVMNPRPTARSLVLDAEQRFEAAGLVFGHGTDNARDEAVFLVFHALDLAFDASDEALDAPVSAAAAAAARVLIERRLFERRPAAYLTGRMWFAGLEFHVDERVLVPRSPLAELVGEGFAPWLDADAISHVLDIGTGSGCIAIATAVALPHVLVDATDISPAALEVAACNVARHGVDARVRLHLADVFPPGATRYDLILANPPYVPQEEFDDLPPEYLHEPAGALLAADEGLAIVARILGGAAARLAPGGVLIMDVGATAAAVEAAFPELPFMWFDFAHGGDGVFMLRRKDLTS